LLRDKKSILLRDKKSILSRVKNIVARQKSILSRVKNVDVRQKKNFFRELKILSRDTKPNVSCVNVALHDGAEEMLAGTGNDVQVTSPAKKLEDLIRLAELCVDLLRQNEEFYAEVKHFKSLLRLFFFL
jgi:hypothetical protein